MPSSLDHDSVENDPLIKEIQVVVYLTRTKDLKPTQVCGISFIYIYIFMNDRFLLENPNELHPRKLTCPLKGGHFKRKVVFQPIFFSEDMFVLGGGCQKEAVFAVVHNDRAPFKTVNPPKKFQSRWF